MKRTLNNKIRIIGGKHRGRKITIIDRQGLRPSPDRVRETVFNWLQNEMAGAQILDAFAGSGAMGLEALSRGAESVLFCDTDSHAVAALSNCLNIWREKHARVIQRDILRLSATATSYDFIFLDPPFNANLHQLALDKFATDTWLKCYGKIYVENAEPVDKLIIPENWQWLKTSKAGQVCFGLLGRKT